MFARRNEGTSVVASVLPGSTFTGTHRGRAGQRKVIEGGGNNRNVNVARAKKTQQTHSHSSPNKDKNLRKQKSEGGRYRASALGQQEWRRTEDSG